MLLPALFPRYALLWTRRITNCIWEGGLWPPLFVKIMKTIPSREDFINLAKGSNIIAVSTELFNDLDTPVSVYYKLVGEEKGFLLESVEVNQKYGRYSFIGAEPFIRLEVYADQLMMEQNGHMRCYEGAPVDTIKRFMAKFSAPTPEKPLPLINGGVIGYLNYDIVATFDRVRGLDLGEEDLLGQFMMCRQLVMFDQLRHTTRLVYMAETDGTDAGAIYDKAVEALKKTEEKLAAPLENIHQYNEPRQDKLDFLARYGEMPESFDNIIKSCRDHIIAGDIFQIVPSQQFREKITQPPFTFYRRLRQANPSPYMFYLNFGETKLVGASPEMLVRVAGDELTTYPIAGTRRRGSNDAEDEALMADLLQDEKECAEHSMLVDLARNDIGRISEAGSVRVTKLKVIEKFSHVMHMVSEVKGKKKPEYTPMDVLKACFPAGTVSGAPKLRAMEIINELEAVRRNAYAGIVGYLDFDGNMDTCITLRTMRIEGDEAIIQAGAGIVYDSVAINEYREILQKAKVLFGIVEEVENNAVAP